MTTVYDVVQIVSADGAKITSYPAGEWWVESHQDDEAARDRAALFNRMCAVQPEFVKYVVEEVDESSASRKLPIPRRWSGKSAAMMPASDHEQSDAWQQVASAIARGLGLANTDTPELAGALLDVSSFFGALALTCRERAKDLEAEGIQNSIPFNDSHICSYISQSLLASVCQTGGDSSGQKDPRDP